MDWRFQSRQEQGRCVARAGCCDLKKSNVRERDAGSPEIVGTRTDVHDVCWLFRQWYAAVDCQCGCDSNPGKNIRSGSPGKSSRQRAPVYVSIANGAAALCWKPRTRPSRLQGRKPRTRVTAAKSGESGRKILRDWPQALRGCGGLCCTFRRRRRGHSLICSATSGNQHQHPVIYSDCAYLFETPPAIDKVVSLTGATPSRTMPILSAARRDRSRLRPTTNGPRSLIFTFTDFPFCGFVTLTTDPIGNVFEAPVSAFGSKMSPLVVLWPTNPGPYQEAVTKWLTVIGLPTGRRG